MSKFDKDNIIFDDWHFNDAFGTVILYFRLDKKYLSSLHPAAPNDISHIAGAELSLEYPVIRNYHDESDYLLGTEFRLENDITLIDELDLDTIGVSIAATIENDDGDLEDIEWCDIWLPDEDIRNLLEISGIIMSLTPDLSTIDCDEW